MWVMVVFIISFVQGANSVAMHDFADQASCESAKQTLEKVKFGAVVKITCVPKGPAPASTP